MSKVPRTTVYPALSVGTECVPDVRICVCSDAAFKNVGTEASSQKGVMVMLLAGATHGPPGSKEIAKARPNPGGICHTLLYYSKKIRTVC